MLGVYAHREAKKKKGIFLVSIFYFPLRLYFQINV